MIDCTHSASRTRTRHIARTGSDTRRTPSCPGFIRPSRMPADWPVDCTRRQSFLKPRIELDTDVSELPCPVSARSGNVSSVSAVDRSTRTTA